MALTKNFFISTTHSCEGRQIIDYLGVVTAHVVAGTGIFSDIVASFSDIFGGRSQSYQKQIGSIYNEVINQIKSKAQLLGANGLIGLKIDIDEISGKAKQMFMVTAVGTAVKIDFELEGEPEVSNTRIIQADELDILLEKKEIIINAQNNQLEYSDDIWNFIIENRVEEIAPFILRKLDSYKEAGLAIYYENFRKKAWDYFITLPHEISKNYLYDFLLNKKTNSEQFVFDLLDELNLVDFNNIQKMLETGDFVIQFRSLQLLNFYKSQYSESDINKMEKLIDLIKNNFPERGKRFSKKGLLSSKENEYWSCEKEHKISLEHEYCPSCTINIYGFSKDQIQPNEAIDILSSQSEEIKKFFSDHD